MTSISASSRRLFGLLSWRHLVWTLVALSVASLLFSPLDATIERVSDVGPWVGLGLIISESAFILGLFVMAWTAGVELGPNPLRWRQRLDGVLATLHRTTLFWVGLAVNTLGGLGTGVVLALAIIVGLPARAWGLLVLPLADLALTAAVRTAVVSGVRQRATSPANPPDPQPAEEKT